MAAETILAPAPAPPRAGAPLQPLVVDDAREERSWRQAFADWWASLSVKTRDAYELQWRHWAGWCAAAGRRPAPADPIDLVEFIHWRGAQRNRSGQLISRSTIDQIRPALGAFHKRAGLPNPCDDPRVAAALKLVRLAPGRDRPEQPVDGLDFDGLRKIEAMTDVSARVAARPDATARERRAATRDAFDCALAETMFSAGLRRSEAAALVWADIAPGRVAGEGLITIRRSKTDQEGRGATRFISAQAYERLQQIRPAQAGPDDSVFGIGGPRIAERLKACARRAKISGRISGHSARRGMAEELVAQGASTAEVMFEGRWRSADMVGRYTAKLDADRGAMARISRERRNGTARS